MTPPPAADTRAQAKQRLYLAVDGLRCPGCADKAARALSDLPGVTEAYVHLGTRTAAVEWEGPLPIDALVGCLEEAGCGVHWVARSRLAAEAAGLARAEAEDAGLGARLALSAAAALPVLLAGPLDLSPVLSFALAAGLLLWAAGPAQAAFARCLDHRSGDPNALFVLAAWPALALSAARLFMPGLLPDGGSHLEALALIIVLTGLARWLEAGPARASRTAGRRLALAVPRRARLADGGWRPTEDLQAGDSIEVRSGEAFPVDAHIASGEGQVEGGIYALGERKVAEGASVRCGEVLLSGSLRASAEASEAASGLSAALEGVRREQAKRAHRETLLERAARFWMVAIVLLAVAAAGAGLARGRGGAWAACAFLSTLCLAYPPAFLLSRAAVFATAALLCRKEGALLRGAEALEAPEVRPAAGALPAESAAAWVQEGRDPSAARAVLERAGRVLRYSLAGVFVPALLLLPLAAGLFEPRWLGAGPQVLAAAASLAWIGFLNARLWRLS